MSIDLSGQFAKTKTSIVKIQIEESHPLIRLSNILPWVILIAMASKDLKQTTKKGYWWLGRKINVRLHLSAYILQKLFDLTDRKIEYGMKDNAAYQKFTGIDFLDDWHAPDHTKITKFRNRLSPETQREIANYIAKYAVGLGFADPAETDFDSTVQEANMSYPSDANIMAKLGTKAKKVIDYLQKKIPGLLPKGLTVDLKSIKEKAQEYFFLAKNTAMAKRKEVFKELHQMLKKELRPVVDICNKMDVKSYQRMPWNIRQSIDQISGDAWRYLLDVAHFVRTNTMKTGKILSLHAKEVTCIKKGKVGKEMEFGRVFQLGRIKGNFLFVLRSISLDMNDKTSFVDLLKEHTKLFGERTLDSLAVDKGYWSAKNQKEAQKRGVKDVGLQCPANVKNSANSMSEEKKRQLRDRRAGIEPLIGHIKHGGQLGRSRMKSDQATLAAGYGSVLGMNLRQLVRHQGGKMKLN